MRRFKYEVWQTGPQWYEVRKYERKLRWWDMSAKWKRIELRYPCKTTQAGAEQLAQQLRRQDEQILPRMVYDLTLDRDD